MKLIKHALKHTRPRSLSFFTRNRKPFTLPLSRSLLNPNELIDEEICPGYDSRQYYPARVGEVLDGRYQILIKAGLGGEGRGVRRVFGLRGI